MRRGWFRYLAGAAGLATLLQFVPTPAAASNGNAGLHLVKSVDPAQVTITPDLSLALSVDKASAIPGDKLTYTALVTNPIATFGMGGSFNAEAIADTDATIAYYWDQVEYCQKGCGNGQAKGDPHWTALAAFVAGQPGYQPVMPPDIAGGMTLTAQSVPRTGVTYPTAGDAILGTDISPKATATWTYQSSIVLTPAQIALLSDPSQIQSIRNVVHFEVTPRNGNAAQPYLDAEAFTNPFSLTANAGAVSNITVKFTLPDGTSVAVGPSQLPALATLNPGGSVLVTTTFIVPVPAAKGANENYLLRLLSLEGSALKASASATGSGLSGSVTATAPQVTTVEHLPIVTIAKDGPAQINAGDTETNPLALVNSGGSVAGPLTVVDSLPNGAQGTVSGVAATLAAGAPGTATATYDIPLAQADGSLTDTATVTWKDANGNSYGPLSASFSTNVHSSLSGATITLLPKTAGPNVVGTTQSFTAHFIDRNLSPISGRPITLSIIGANPGTQTANTDSAGNAPFVYTGANQGTDQVQATFTAGALTLQSNTVSVSWITPIKTVSTTLVNGTVYHNDVCGCFNATPSSIPVFGIQVPTINFNPPEGTVPHNPTSIGVFTRPMFDVTTDVAGNFTGAIELAGRDSSGTLHEAGSGDLFQFDMVLTGTFTIAASGNLTFNFFSDDGFIFGIKGATRVSGALQNPPASMFTAFNSYPVMGAFNQPTAPREDDITVNFPAPGTYPYEIDYNECCSGQLALTLATGGKGLPPTGTISLTPFNIAPATVGQTQTLHAAVMDASGVAIANQPVTLNITGANARQLTGTTDATGLATFSYQGASPGQDSIQAAAQVSGVPELSNVVGMTWNPAPPAPTITTPSPADGSIVTKPTPITASITPPAGQTISSWSVTYQQSGGLLVQLAQGIGAPSAQLATFDPTLLTNGSYAITITVNASGGGQQVSSSTVIVLGNLKLGRYTIQFKDLAVPVNGLPMEVLRTYDSTDASNGDFGIGWRLSVANFRVATNRTLGAGGWTQYNQSCVLGLCLTAFQSASPRFVTVVFPDQHVEVFDFKPTGGTNVFFGCTPAFAARASIGTTSTLVALDDTACNYTGDGNLYGANGFYNPQRFQLTTRSGQVIVLDAKVGLISMTDRNGNSLTIDASGVHTSSGTSINYTRDTTGRITTITGPSGQTLHYAYSSAGDLASSTSPNGAVTNYTYDSSHHLLQTVGPGGPIQTLRYDSNGRLSSITDGAGKTTQVSSDLTGQQQTIIDATGRLTTVITYDDVGDAVQIDRISGGTTLTTRIAYDAAGHILKITDALGGTTSAVYDSAGHMTSLTDPMGTTSNYSYDSLGDVTAVTAPGGVPLVTMTYDAAGNLMTITDAGGNRTSISYDHAGNMVTRTDAVGRATSYTYTASGNMASATDSAGVTRFTSDASGRVTSATDPNGRTTALTYDSDGNLLTQTDGGAHQRTWTYDGLDRQVSFTDANGNRSTLTYDAAGHVASVTDGNGVTVTRTFDPNGRLLTASAPDGSSASFTYDGFGRMASATSPASLLTFTYDALDHLVSQTTGGGQPANTLTFSYDANGRRISTTGPEGTATYRYDSLSNLVGLTDAGSGDFTFSYDSALRLKTLLRPDGVSDNNTYDASGQLTLRISSFGATTLASQSYTYSSSGQRLSRTDLTNTATYQFDPAAQLSAVANSSPSVPGESYTYDAAGNRTASGSSTVAYDTGGRMVRYGTTTYTYDNDGQRISATDSAGRVTNYSWNAFRKLVAVIMPGGTTVKYRYDALGRRVEVAQGSTVNHYAYDGQNLRLQYNGSALAASYTFAPETKAPLEVRQGNTPYYYLSDAQGSAVGLADQAGNLVATQRYDSFGNPLSSSGSVANALTYIGQQFDASAGLYFLNARYYDPQTGSFLSQDPLPNVNPYTYALNDPVDISDPSGADAPEYAIQLQKDIVVLNEFGEPQTEFVVQGPLRATVQAIIRMPPDPLAAGGDDALALKFLLAFIRSQIGQGLSVGVVMNVGFASLVFAVIVFVLVCAAITPDVPSAPASPSGTPVVTAPKSREGGPCSHLPDLP